MLLRVIRKLATFLNNPQVAMKNYTDEFCYKLLLYCNGGWIYSYLPDKLALKMKYKWLLGKKLNLCNPATFSEKIQWLKLYDRNPLYTTLVDKAAVKDYVASMIGVDHIIPTYAVWNTVEDIDFDVLPEQFVLKCTHDSASVVVCKNKADLNCDAVKEKLAECMKRSQYTYGREWPYKRVPHRIIAEKYMEDESGYELKDYKVFLFNGKAKVIQVDFGRFSEHKRNLYTLEWQRLPYSLGYDSDDTVVIPRPKCLMEMVESAELLGKNFSHSRIDFYVINDEYFFGEITFYHGSGFEKFTDPDKDLEWGMWLKLPSKEK